ncbi:ATP-grasp ribosomal peptide maturase [Streptomyces albireticuli]|uniref:RimK domain-containing protein n=1 Tax=Streptomyces albireticuli TaxID=1940 RepID=A0A2A2CZQ9_9ACTN|nr:ATP-grasp ribosomal peptide maturase [Streptomyces albireticuli]MCD9143631.1 ATP-grasp ribosomal peptide maturase [Streptomyces albireticuli]MCD9161938.1 ATP-grasp ribosomal peptide maturase [Streptomyces albireticuli]MCD9191748.1 ATP-grasp ribosomal peptide maturase [Streptomyces albireticuli]PAU44745.1 RimK domain-containing protein [Streptomyces albireticuli]
MSPILVIAARDDWPTDRVVHVLADRGATVFRMDTAEFPQALTLAGRIDARRGWTGGLATSHRAVDLADITATYYRAPNMFQLAANMSGPEYRFAAAQARAGLGGILSALDCRWVSHPAAMSRAEYKPIQLAAARECGLTIPPTLITNTPDTVRAFAGDTGGPLICKPVATPAFIEGGQLKIVYTRKLTAHDLDDLTGIDTTAHLFQRWVDKTHEVRLTVVGDRTLAAEVHAGSAEAHTDWRSDYRSLTYRATETPNDVATGVRRLMRRLDLRFGALDFIVSPDGTWTFLEVNPCGQWDWIQHATGLPIAEAIADELMTGAAE